MKVENMIRVLMSRLAPAAVICGVVLSQCLSAATLNVEFDVRTRAAESDPAYKRNSIAIFVLDRSESMTWRPANGEKAKDGWVARNRNQLLCESFQDRIRTMSENEPNTKVFVLEFSYDIKPLEGPFALNSPHDVERLLSWEGLKDVKCMGKTLLYDARERALEKAEEFYSKDPSVKVELFVYTDGDNDTPPSGYWRRKKLDENGKEQVDFWGNPIEERVEVRYSSRDNKTAKKKFDEKWAKKKAAYSESGKLELHWRWLGKGTPPPGIKNTRKDEYEMLLTSASRVLKSLSAMPEQKLGVELTVPIPSQYENSLNDLRATTVLEISGKRISSKFISLQPGKHTVTFQIPDDFGANAADGKLSIADVPDAWERMVLKPPAPLELTFAAPGKLSFLDIDPKDDFFVRKGSTKEFKAKATEDADIHWSWPGGSKTTNACPITFTTTTPDPLDVLVTAKKKGFLPVEEKIKVHVIDANVGVSVGTSRPMVGEAIEFLAKAHGQPESYSWKIDKQPMPGQDARLKVPVFSGGSGPHVVSVRAYYGHGIMADSGEVPFVVAAKPYIEIAEPDSGSEYPFGEKVECKANVEGDFDKVVWELEGPAGEKQESAVDKTAKASRPVFFKPAKGGKYTLKATAVGAAGSLPAKASVVLKVAYENLGINITSHASGTPVPLGRNVENLNLVAEVTGDKITKAKWFVRSESGGEREIRTTPVLRENGKRVAKCSFSPDPSTKDGSSLFVRAEAIFGDGAPSEPVFSPAIELIATRYAAIEVEAKVNGNEANGCDVRFGDQVELHAHCEGDIDSGKVQWCRSVGGVVSNMAIGLHCTSPKEVPNKSLPNGDNLRTVHYFAVAGLSDGSAVTSRTVIVHHYCPDVKFAINLPPGADGLPQRSFRPGDVVHLCLPESEQPLTDVEWDFGDGTKVSGCNVEHSYSDEKSHKIMARGRCAKCGKPFSAVVDVSTKCPDLELSVVLKGEERFAKKCGLKKPVNVELSVKNGDATEVSWDFGDGGTAKGMAAAHSYEKYGTYAITASAKCKRCGKHFTASSEKIEVTVIPPQAVLEIVQKGSHYGTGDTITLSAKQSKGDIVDCIWEVDGKERIESRGKKEVDVKLPDRPCEMVAKVTLIGPEGTKQSEAQREIRVRYGAKYIALLIVLVVFLVGVLAWLLLNNGPTDWKAKLYSCKAIDHATSTGKDEEIKILEDEVPLPLVGAFWSLLNKKAVIAFDKVLANESLRQFLTSDTIDFMKTCSNAKIIVNPNPDPLNPDEEESLIYCGSDSGNPSVLVPYKAADEIAVNAELKNPMLDYRQFVIRERDNRSKDPEVVLRFILDRSKVNHKYEFRFVVLTSCVIAAAFWAALKFAI